jgi:pimeloyl-ACP methyl ester carboxylesterase
MFRRRFLAALVFSLAPTLAFGQDKFFDSAGVSVRYLDQGAGEPVILLHGQGNILDQMLRPARLKALGLSSGYRVIGFDARGHGKSGKPHDPAMYGREMALDVVRLMDHLGITRAHVLGYSMGAFTVSQLLTLRPERFLSATLVAGAGPFEWTPQAERYAEQVASEHERDCVSRTMILELLPVGDEPPTDEDIKARSKACFEDVTQDRLAIAALVRGRRGWVITPAQAAAVRVPTLGIVGSLDPLAAGMRELNKLRPDMTLIVVEGATHGSPGDGE